MLCGMSAAARNGWGNVMQANLENMFCEVDGKRRTIRWLFANAEKATNIWAENNPGLTALGAGKDSRGYLFSAVKICGAWRIVAGCRNFSVADARKHWGRVENLIGPIVWRWSSGSLLILMRS
jgi:hypothetical protein